MTNYQRWNLLNEQLNFPLGIKSLASLGISGDLGQLLDEKKNVKKMDGEEIDLKGGDDADIKVAPEKDDDDGDHKCSCGDKKPAMDPEDGRDQELMMKKKMKKNMKKESMFDNIAPPFADTPIIGTPEYEKAFWASIKGHMGNPNQRNDSGVNLGEEVLLEPKDETPTPAPAPAAGPGETGFAPVGRIGEFASEKPAVAEWEKQWTSIG